MPPQPSQPGEGLATLHVFGVGRRHIPAAVVRMAADRRALRCTPGLRFWKLLGTGRGRTFSARDADPRHWALFAVWEDAAALDAFEKASPVLRRWDEIVEERWRVDLVPVRTKGRWANVDPFETLPHVRADGRPVAVLTRARLRLPQALAFWRAVPPVAAEVNGADGLRFAVGVGEAPVGLQATFSVWRDEAAVDEFAYRGANHREVIRRTRDERWYAEELFARFAVVGAIGTVGGVDPLAA